MGAMKPWSLALLLLALTCHAHAARELQFDWSAKSLAALSDNSLSLNPAVAPLSA